MVDTHNTLVIVGKPLQLFIALSVIDQMGVRSSSQILIVDNFKGANELSNRFNKFDSKNYKIQFISSFDEAYSFLTLNVYKNLLIDSDLGVKKYIQLFRAKRKSVNINICVYEEGWGSYRSSDIYKRYKSTIFQYFGIGCAFGGCSLTDHIYIYNIEKYKASLPTFSHKSIKIQQTLADFLYKNFLLFSYIFNLNKIENLFNVQNSDNIHLVLTGHTPRKAYRMESLERFKKITGVKLWKPHPHIKEKVQNVPGFIMINGAIPAEILLIYLSSIAKKVFVYHFKTSTEEYIKNENIVFVRLDRV